MKSRRKSHDADFVLIPSLEASDEEKLEQDRIMRRGNRVLMTYHARVKAKVGGRYPRHRFRKELFEAMKQSGPVCIEGIGISATDLPLIKAVRNIEWAVLCTYSRLFYDHAEKWSNRNHNTGMSFEDFYNEATTAAINAIYGFTDDGIVFMTFLYTAITRRLLTASNDAKPLSHWTQENKKLYGQFKKTHDELGVEASFDEVVKLMDLNDDQIADLRDMMVHVVNHTDIVRSENQEESADPDVLGVLGAAVETPEVDLDLGDAMNNTPMTTWERTVLDAFLSGNRGWASEVARNHINPDTQEAYSRRAPKLALDRVLDRIRATYAGVEVADAA